jgi:hypothetical protein
MPDKISNEKLWQRTKQTHRTTNKGKKMALD